MEGLLINEAATVAYSPGLSAAILTNVKQQPTAPILKETGSSTGIAFWGDDNLFPQTVLKEAEKSTIIPSTLEWKARALYSGGIIYGTTSYDEKGEEKFTPVKDDKVEAFFRASNIKRYAIEAATDFYWFYNVFPELVLSKDRKQIVALTTQEATFSRWGKQDKKGNVETCFISANWDKSNSIEEATQVKVIDPYYDRVASIQEGKDHKFIYPVSYPSPGKVYYQLATWNSVRTSGWLEVAQAIPAFKKALFKNQITMKYIIEVSTWWWEWKYPTFKSLKAEERKKLMDLELAAFQSFMQGEEKAGNSMMTTFESNPQTNKEYPGWKITPVDNKIKDGIYIEDSQEASSHLMYALGVDPTLIGNSPGKNMGAGSGSDKRVAFNVYISLCKIHQDLILEPLEVIRDYNGWNPNYQFRFRNSQITTLDSGKETSQKPA